jgi:hypothetical protein
MSTAVLDSYRHADLTFCLAKLLTAPERDVHRYTSDLDALAPTQV